MTPEATEPRQLLYGSKRDVYRVIFAIDDSRNAGTVLHIRHGAGVPLTTPGKR